MFKKCRTTLLILVTLGSTACAASRGVKLYAPQQMALSGVASADLFTQLKSAVTDTNWDLVSANPEEGVIQALTPMEDIAGAKTRERWTFEMKGGNLSVAMRMEVQWEANAPWMTTDYVCDSYAYLRERAFILQLEEALIQTQTQPVGVAMTSVSVQ